MDMLVCGEDIASVMRDTAMRITEGKSVPEHFDREHIRDVLGPPKYFEELADKSPQVGVVTGLGWTPTGGRLLFVEVTSTWGKGKLRLTGRLGDVMKESAQAALSHVRSRGATLQTLRQGIRKTTAALSVSRKRAWRSHTHVHVNMRRDCEAHLYAWYNSHGGQRRPWTGS